MPRRRSLLAAPALLFAGRAAAQESFPSRPLRLIAPFAPGGQTDTVARLLVPKMAEFLGQNIVVENRSGAGGTIGDAMVATAPPDGYTLLLESFSFVISPLIHRDLTFNYETDFAVIGQPVALPYVLAVRKDFPATDLASFVAAAKARPGVTYGTPGVGSPGHLAGAMLASRAGIQLEHVPYRGGAEAARDLAGGSLDAVLITANSIKPLIDDGRAKGIGLTSGERRGSLAMLPTFAESGFPGFDLTSWNGLFAPAATPRAVRDKLEAALRHATTDPGTIHRLALTGNDAITTTAAEFEARIRRDKATVAEIIRTTGMRLE